MNAKAAFAKLKGMNFMTPNVIEFLDLKNGLMIEVSEGTGFDNKPIWGVTVINADGCQNFDDSGMFHTKPKAYAHVKKLESK